MQVRAIHKVPCPKFDEFDNDVLDMAAVAFDRLSTLKLLPAYMAVEDKTRAEINHTVSKVLGIPDYDADALTGLWCAEPSIRGLK